MTNTIAMTATFFSVENARSYHRHLMFRNRTPAVTTWRDGLTVRATFERRFDNIEWAKHWLANDVDGFSPDTISFNSR